MAPPCLCSLIRCHSTPSLLSSRTSFLRSEHWPSLDSFHTTGLLLLQVLCTFCSLCWQYFLLTHPLAISLQVISWTQPKLALPFQLSRHLKLFHLQGLSQCVMISIFSSLHCELPHDRDWLYPVQSASPASSTVSGTGPKQISRKATVDWEEGRPLIVLLALPGILRQAWVNVTCVGAVTLYRTVLSKM